MHVSIVSIVSLMLKKGDKYKKLTKLTKLTVQILRTTNNRIYMAKFETSAGIDDLVGKFDKKSRLTMRRKAWKYPDGRIFGYGPKEIIKAEYYCGVKSWWAFLIVGLLAATGSLFVQNTYISIFLGIFAFSSFWSIGEVFKQRERVRKGWFPMNPKRKENY